jgi:hypothetical protein
MSALGLGRVKTPTPTARVETFWRKAKTSVRAYIFHFAPVSDQTADIAEVRANKRPRGYSITSSARSEKEAGISKPSALAVLRLTTN